MVKQTKSYLERVFQGRRSPAPLDGAPLVGYRGGFASASARERPEVPPGRGRRRNSVRKFTGIALLLAATAPAAAQPAGERLVQAVPAGFVVGYEVSRPEASIEERVPQGETVQRWTRMVTTQRFAGAALRISPEGLLQTMANGLPAGCPGGKAGAIRTFTVAGRPAAEFRADCPRNPSHGQPESFFARAIAGASDMHIVQVAFRRVPTKADEAWAAAHLSSVLLCASAARSGPCAR